MRRESRQPLSSEARSNLAERGLSPERRSVSRRMETLGEENRMEREREGRSVSRRMGTLEEENKIHSRPLQTKRRVSFNHVSNDARLRPQYACKKTFPYHNGFNSYVLYVNPGIGFKNPVPGF
ncbi:hypothetical protein I3842_13G095400 [Carya illinoinensis]|uniref:Uncharacterized protein n=1 Tax=Carya illinoinensis TaxID=32201 RepID=A0A922DB82_CARIL|nr:hypothetical protein I3842_13G095400 [Carya illinoinensis]